MAEGADGKDFLARYAILFNHTHDGVAVFQAVDGGQDFIITGFNPAAERIEQISRGQVVGRRLTEVFPGVEKFGLLEVMRRVYLTGQPETHPMNLYQDERHSGWRINEVCRTSAGEIICIYADTTKDKMAEEELRQALERVKKTLLGTVRTVFLAVETRDPFTSGHQKRVAGLAEAIAQQLGLPEDLVETISLAAAIHDVGKMAVPADILIKPKKLSRDEYKIIMIHPQVGQAILKEAELPLLVSLMIFQHHERLNGSGYPQGVKAGRIIYEAKILTVADVAEAMTSHRPYRPARSLEEAMAELEQNRGVLYDRGVVKACQEVFRQGFRFN